MNYKIVLTGFELACPSHDTAKTAAMQLMDAGLYYVNVDEVKKGKGVSEPTVFVKNQTIPLNSLHRVACLLEGLATVYDQHGIEAPVHVKTEA